MDLQTVATKEYISQATAATLMSSDDDNAYMNVTRNASTSTYASDTPEATCNYALFQFTLYVCVMGVVCLVGFCGNIVSFFVLRKDGSSPVAAFQLQALAVADNFLLFFWTNHFVVGYLLRYLGVGWTESPHWLWYYRVYAYPMMYVGQSETIWLTVLIAVNRYIVVWMPLKARLICTARTIRMQVLAVTVFSILYNGPRFFELAVESATISDVNVTSNLTVNVKPNNIYRYTELGNNALYRHIYGDIMYQIVTFALPLALLAFFNTSVMFAFYKAFKRRQSLTGTAVTRHETNENNLTLLMIAVVLIFMVCQAPARVVQHVWNYQTDPCSPENYTQHFSSTLEAINSSVNFVVYFTFRRRFRRILQRSCLRCCPCSGETFGMSSPSFRSYEEASVLSRCNSRVDGQVNSDNHHHRHHHHKASSILITTTTELGDETEDCVGETTVLRQTGV